MAKFKVGDVVKWMPSDAIKDEPRLATIIEIVGPFDSIYEYTLLLFPAHGSQGRTAMPALKSEVVALTELERLIYG